MSSNYKVTLTPLEAFFFGGEHTFGRDELRGESSRYSASSTHFPQQTAILGMLRKTLLIQNKNLTMHIKGEWVDSKSGKKGNDANYHEAASLSGKDAFCYEKESDLGAIQNISPVFLTWKNKSYIINAKDATYTPKILNSKMSFNGLTKETFMLEGFNAKEYKDDTFIATDKTELRYEDLFETVFSVGIKKAQGQESNEDGFFQKKSYMLKDKASFTFYVELAQAISWREAYVTLGADQSAFQLQIQETDENFETLFSGVFDKKSIDRVVLNSETKVDEEVYNAALFVLGKRTPYKQLEHRSGKKSKRFYLLERGSVIYAKNIEKLSAALSQTHLQKVGINNFTTIKGS